MAKAKWIGGFLGLLSGGPIGALAGFVLGAHPMEIALEIYQALVARIRFDYSGILPNLQATAAPLA